MSNVVYPSLPGLKLFNSTKTPQWSTQIQRATSGYEARLAYFSVPIWKWVLDYEFLRTYGSYVEFQTLANFFNARQGSYDSFLYDDPTDNTVPAGTPQTIGTGDGTTVAFQLGRSLVAAGLFEPIYNLNATPILYDNGVVVNPLNYTVSATGLVTFGVAPVAGHIVAWSGTYYWRCRFEEDTYDFDYFAYKFWSVKKVSFVSVKGY